MENQEISPVVKPLKSQEQKKFRISWRRKGSKNITGHGEYMDKERAESWLEEAKKTTPELQHWLEAEDD